MPPILNSPSSQAHPSNNVNSSSNSPYRSTPDSRSSVLIRAREYTKKVEDDARRRSKSLDRNSNNHLSSSPSFSSSQNNNRTTRQTESSTVSGHSYGSRGRREEGRRSTNSHDSQTYRSRSVGRASNGSTSSYHRTLSMRERAIASMEKESDNKMQQKQQQQYPQQARQPSFSSPISSHQNEIKNHSRMSPDRSVRSHARSLSRDRRSSTGEDQLTVQQQQQQEQQQAGGGEAVVSPELLVDALSGHEDGLLAIAERMMEHYDSGYDAMGEAIIDAFADVQKLFQHVVEAAHMEGAAFESSRREEEIRDLKRRAACGESNASVDDEIDCTARDDLTSPLSTNGPVRIDEFIDKEVKDCLNDAIRKGVSLKEERHHDECFKLYEKACQWASALLPVDSDHRGRLQLSIARAESMSPDRGCAILRYAMDDVLRSGLRAGKIPKNYPLSDPSKRADVVFSKPSKGTTPQSSEEQLNSLVEEMKEIIDAPVYENTPLQDVAKRFWSALQENQKILSKNEDRLEHNLGKLKGDFLLARAEWEEKLTSTREECEIFKRKYTTIKNGKEVSSMEDARGMMSQKFMQQNQSQNNDSEYRANTTVRSSSFRSTTSRPEFKRATESVASMSSNLAAHAKTLVGSFACAGNNERTGQVLSTERATEEWRDRRVDTNSQQKEQQSRPQHHRGLEMSQSSPYSGDSRSYRENSAASRRVDV